MMPRSLAWAREQNLSSRAFAARVLCRRAVLLISGVLSPFCFHVATMSVAVSLRVVPAWPMGIDAYEINPAPIASERGHQGVLLVGFFIELLVAAEVHAEADLEEDKEQSLRFKGWISGDGSAGTPRAYIMSGAAPPA